MFTHWILVAALILGAGFAASSRPASRAGQPSYHANGQQGYEGQPGNQGNGQQGYEGQPGHQGGPHGH